MEIKRTDILVYLRDIMKKCGEADDILVTIEFPGTGIFAARIGNLGITVQGSSKLSDREIFSAIAELMENHFLVSGKITA